MNEICCQLDCQFVLGNDTEKRGISRNVGHEE